VAVLFTNARNLGFPTGSFDIALCGFTGWNDCFDFVRFEFTQPDTKASEIRRVLRKGGRFVCCSWEEQKDLAWMEEAMIRHYPAILEDGEYLQRRPIGMAYEKAQGYEIIFRAGGFRDIEISRETAEFVSTDEEEWWRQMQNIGWDSLFEKITIYSAANLQKIKEAIFKDLQPYKQPDGIHFTKSIFYISGVK
jgi:ubiquinone/menaquinone biosynthesis C-methylase UbiE